MAQRTHRTLQLLRQLFGFSHLSVFGVPLPRLLQDLADRGDGASDRHATKVVVVARCQAVRLGQPEHEVQDVARGLPPLRWRLARASARLAPHVATRMPRVILRYRAEPAAVAAYRSHRPHRTAVRIARAAACCQRASVSSLCRCAITSRRVPTICTLRPPTS